MMQKILSELTKFPPPPSSFSRAEDVHPKWQRRHIQQHEHGRVKAWEAQDHTYVKRKKKQQNLIFMFFFVHNFILTDKFFIK